MKSKAVSRLFNKFSPLRIMSNSAEVPPSNSDEARDPTTSMTLFDGDTAIVNKSGEVEILHLEKPAQRKREKILPTMTEERNPPCTTTNRENPPPSNQAPRLPPKSSYQGNKNICHLRYDPFEKIKSSNEPKSAKRNTTNTSRKKPSTRRALYSDDMYNMDEDEKSTYSISANSAISMQSLGIFPSNLY